MFIIITEEDIWNKLRKKIEHFVIVQYYPFYPTNLAKPRMMGLLKMSLNIILVLRIITHAQGFEPIKIFGGEGGLAAPYFRGAI